MTSSALELQRRHVPLVLVLVTLALWPVPAQLLELWLDSDRPYSHGLLLAPLAGYLVLLRSTRLGRTLASPSWTAYALFVGLLFVWLLGRAADILVVTQVTFPFLLLLATGTVFGWTAARAVAFPIGLIFYAIPVWNYFTPFLQSMTVAAVRFSLDGYGIPVHVDGNLISIPEGTFEVAGGCAGLHYFVVALVIASLYAHQSGRGLVTGLMLIGAAAIAAVLTNWIRVGALVWIGHETNMQHYLVAQDHYYFGWILFALALVPFFATAGWITSKSTERGGERQGAGAPKAAAPGWLLALFALTLLLPVALLGIASWPVRGSASIVLPGGIEGWSGPRAAAQDWSPRLVGAHGQALGEYQRADQSVDAYIGVYLSQGQGRELVGDHYPFATGAVGDGSARLRPVEGPLGGVVREWIVRDARTDSQRLVWYWYLVGATSTASNLEAKLIQGLRAVTLSKSAAMVAVSVSCPAACGDADRDALQRYLSDMGASLEAAGVAAQGSS